MDNVSIEEDSDMSASFPDLFIIHLRVVALRRAYTQECRCAIRLARCRLVPLCTPSSEKNLLDYIVH
jgi:hypothetical protein